MNNRWWIVQRLRNPDKQPEFMMFKSLASTGLMGITAGKLIQKIFTESLGKG